MVEKLTDCSPFSKIPDLGFIVGGHILNLKPEDYLPPHPVGGIAIRTHTRG